MCDSLVSMMATVMALANCQSQKSFRPTPGSKTDSETRPDRLHHVTNLVGLTYIYGVFVIWGTVLRFPSTLLKPTEHVSRQKIYNCLWNANLIYSHDNLVSLLLPLHGLVGDHANSPLTHRQKHLLNKTNTTAKTFATRQNNWLGVCNFVQRAQRINIVAVIGLLLTTKWPERRIWICFSTYVHLRNPK